ncbi:hypothetical protein PspLS_05067 [Pyricularia sp. CBS 133598]|nr:hypothetical protein PspLS_05067 [Pyricularia sp. CBS 133598]
MALFTLLVNPNAESGCGTERIGLFKLGWAQGRDDLDHARHFTLKQKGPTMTATLLGLEGGISARQREVRTLAGLLNMMEHRSVAANGVIDPLARTVFSNVAFTLLLAKAQKQEGRSNNRSAAAEDRKAAKYLEKIRITRARQG